MKRPLKATATCSATAAVANAAPVGRGMTQTADPLRHKMAAFAIAAVALSGAAFGDADLNTFMHEGSVARPLPSTTSSAEGFLVDELDSIAHNRAGSTLEGPFDSWCRSVVEALLNGSFNSFTSGLTITIR